MGFSHDKKKGHCCLLTTNIILLVLSLVIITFVLIALQKQSLPELRLIYAVSFLFALLLAIMAILSFGALCKGCWVYFYFVLCVICTDSEGFETELLYMLKLPLCSLR